MRRFRPRLRNTYGFPANNNSILEFCRAYPNKFLGFWGIDPHKGMDAVREVEHVIKDLGMRGIATDPYLAHCPAERCPLLSHLCQVR